MSALVPVNPVLGDGVQRPTLPGNAAPVEPGTAVPKLQLVMEDALASARRLWVRGHLTGLPQPEKPGTAEHSWWSSWRNKAESPAPRALHVETRVAHHSLAADTVLCADDRFEVLFTAPLPQARKGWRIARNHVSCLGQTADGCCVVLEPPTDAVGAVVVLLPLEYTCEADGPRRLADCDSGSSWAKRIRTLEQGPEGYHPIYYLACVPAGAVVSAAELNLAAHALGLPTGHFVLLPAGNDRLEQVDALTAGLDNLRWLFADQLDLWVFNLEPSLNRTLAGALAPATDRAVVRAVESPGISTNGVGRLSPAAQRLPHAHHPVAHHGLTRHPVVFCHGMLAMSTLRMNLPKDLNCFSPLKEFLQDRGYRVLFPQVPPTSGVPDRAARLKEQILAWTDEPINLIAHSMGGLDARHLITHLGMAERVASLTTISTPHRGTYLADWFVANFRHRVPLLLALEALGINMEGFRSCRLAECREFNRTTPNDPRVKYFSYGGAVAQSRVSPALRRAWNLLTPVEGPNDGMVAVTSARWGEYLGTISADHFAQTPDAAFLRPDEDFDCLGFYSRLVENLARRGF